MGSLVGFPFSQLMMSSFVQVLERLCSINLALQVVKQITLYCSIEIPHLLASVLLHCMQYLCSSRLVCSFLAHNWVHSSPLEVVMEIQPLWAEEVYFHKDRMSHTMWHQVLVVIVEFSFVTLKVSLYFMLHGRLRMVCFSK